MNGYKTVGGLSVEAEVDRIPDEVKAMGGSAEIARCVSEIAGPDEPIAFRPIQSDRVRVFVNVKLVVYTVGSHGVGIESCAVRPSSFDVL